MAFGSDEFPLGPAGGFPRQRISTSGNPMIPPMGAEEIYAAQDHARLPSTEKDFHSSVNRAKMRMKFGMSHDMMRLGRSRRPRYTALHGLGVSLREIAAEIRRRKAGGQNYGSSVSSARQHVSPYEHRGWTRGVAAGRRSFFGARY